MNYRHLGKHGLKISELSLGSWVTYKNQVDVEKSKELIKAAFDLGVNFLTTPKDIWPAVQKQSWVRHSKNWACLGNST